jgi:hypothetical protein
MASGYEASYDVSQNGNTTVFVRSSSPMKFRAAYVGTGSLEFMWVSSGKSSHWQFTPTLLDQMPAQYSETTSDDGKGQMISVEIGNRLFPAAGLLKTNVTGEIRAPAIHFDLPHAYDLWVFLLRSPWFPLKIDIEKSPLIISHGSAQATAQIESNFANFGDIKSLRADVSLYGEGFKRVWLTLKRSVNRASVEETLGELTSGMETFTWKPTLRNFDVVLVTYSNMSLTQFLDFLKYLGAETHQSFLTGSYMSSNFLLCDGLTIGYRLSLTGEKHLLGHERDETRITLTS